MAKVHIVRRLDDACEENYIVGVFSTKEKAREIVELLGGFSYIHSFELDVGCDDNGDIIK